MARINIEDKWWSDVRRSALIRKVGDEERADGAAIKLWRNAFEYWKNQKQAMPKQCFDLLPFATALLEVNLAVLQNDLVYVKGASEHFDWIFKRAEAGRKGGQKSAENRQKIQAKPKQRQAMLKQCSSNAQAPLSTDVAIVKQKQPSYSSSFSSSSSCSFFENIYVLYPKRDGSQNKAKGMATCEKKFTTPEQIAMLEKAVGNYKRWCNDKQLVGTEKVQMFSTFVNGDVSEWANYQKPIDNHAPAYYEPPKEEETEEDREPNKEDVKLSFHRLMDRIGPQIVKEMK